MRKRNYIMILAAGILLMIVSAGCVNNLLDRKPNSELPESEFWKTENDAYYALYGVYSAARDVFGKEYVFDGQGDYLRAMAGTPTLVTNIHLGYRSTRFDRIQGTNSFRVYFRHLYALVGRANYAITNIEKMIENTSSESMIRTLEAIMGECRLLRGMAYFRLITMWGDVPYFDWYIESNDEAIELPRTPIEIIKDAILEDMSYAIENMYDTPTSKGITGKAAAYAFRGKVQLYWACWNNFGWPELSELGTFAPDKDKAVAAYSAAAADFRHIIENESAYGLALFRNGEPGDCDELGKCDILPNYYYMFTPEFGNTSPENLMVISHGGIGSSQSEQLMYDFGSRSQEGGLMQFQPRLRIIDMYQSTITGEYCTPLLMKTKIPSGQDPYTYPNSYLNPESYRDRDYRMKASIVWEYETMECMNNRVSTGKRIYSYKNHSGTNVGGSGLDAINTVDDASGVIMRKYVRNYAGQGAGEGDFSFPIMRLADVYLMYAEAINEANNGPDELAVELINRIRYRGNLPPLVRAKYATKDDFFNAIEQERIVELFAEGHRPFDLRRWRRIGNVAGPALGNGLTFYDSWGDVSARMLRSVDSKTYDRAHIFMIPQQEMDKNPYLIQTPCWQ